VAPDGSGEQVFIGKIVIDPCHYGISRTSPVFVTEGGAVAELKAVIPQMFVGPEIPVALNGIPTLPFFCVVEQSHIQPMVAKFTRPAQDVVHHPLKMRVLVSLALADVRRLST